MGMIADIAIEGVVKKACQFLEKELETAEHIETKSAIRRMGREALTWFDWTTPDWARRYERVCHLWNHPNIPEFL